MATTETAPSIAAAVVTQGSRVLLVRRRRSEGQLSWQFPAGAIDGGETAEQAAVREAAEEVGLTVRAIDRLGERVHPKTGRMMFYVGCETLSGTPHVADDDELDAIAWASLEELPNYVPYGLYPPVQGFLDRVLAA